MSYVYIGAAAIIGLMVGFVALAILWLTRTVAKSIEVHTIDLISEYDDLLEDRSRQLIRAENRIVLVDKKDSPVAVTPEEDVISSSGAMPAASGLLNATQRIGATVYRDNTVGQVYHQIRDGFAQDTDSIFAKLKLTKPMEIGGPATYLLENLSFEQMCNMSTLPRETQYQLLAETLPDQGVALLEAYGARHKHFNSLSFYSHLKEMADLEPKPPLIWVAPGTVISNCPPRATIVVDEEICEGVQVEVGNTLYDFCIRAREIG